MIVKAASESLTNSPADFSNQNATICCTSENAASEKTEFDAIFRKTPAELLKYLLNVNRDCCESDGIKTDEIRATKKRKNSTDDSSEEVKKTVTHGEFVSVTNKIKQNSFCNDFHYDKRTVEMGVFSLSCNSAKCGLVSVWQPLPEVNHGRMDERYDDECETGENVGKIQSRLLSEEVQSFRDVLQRTVSSEESTRTEQFSDDDLPFFQEDLPPETLEFILSETEKSLHIESPDVHPKDSPSECTELTELGTLSDTFSRSVFSPIPSTSKDLPPVISENSAKTKETLGKNLSEKNTKVDEKDEMVLVPSGKIIFQNIFQNKIIN